MIRVMFEIEIKLSSLRLWSPHLKQLFFQLYTRPMQNKSGGFLLTDHAS